MARILIFKSDATVDSAGAAVDHALTTDSDAPKVSKAFRLFGRDPVPQFGLEFLLTGAAGGSTMDVNFLVEHFNDVPTPTAVPTSRQCAVTPAATSWPHTLTAEAAGSGVVNLYKAVHTVQDLTVLRPSTIVDLAVRAYWARLKVWVASIPASSVLTIWALVGGHENLEYIEALTTPYAYNDLLV
jgi:hypothetical protein